VTRKSTVPAHPPTPDPDVPADQQGHAYCRRGVAIVEGDPRHTMPVVPEQADHRNRYEQEN